MRTWSYLHRGALWPWSPSLLVGAMLTWFLLASAFLGSFITFQSFGSTDLSLLCKHVAIGPHGSLLRSWKTTSFLKLGFVLPCPPFNTEAAPTHTPMWNWLWLQSQWIQMSLAHRETGASYTKWLQFTYYSTTWIRAKPWGSVMPHLFWRGPRYHTVAKTWNAIFRKR